MSTLDVIVATIGRAHGLRGEVALILRTDQPEERFQRGASFAVDAPTGRRTLTVHGTRLQQDRWYVSFEEVTDRTSGEDPFGALREWHTARAEHLPGWLSLRMELILYALRSPEFRPLLAERERIARDAHTRGVETAFAGREATPPAAPDFLALIVHALEDGLLVQRMLFPDEISDQVVVDAVELLMRGWLGSASAQ